MEIVKTEISDLYLIKCFNGKDERGSFTKVYSENEFEKVGIKTDLKETYYSISKKNVIRGMHFQIPPYDHEKIVHVIKGKVKDVVLDLRKDSSTYGQWAEFILDDIENMALYIPKGCAHGFMSLSHESIMLYQVSSVYNSECDSGIAYNSFGYDWNINEPVISRRDRGFIGFDAFQSPF